MPHIPKSPADLERLRAQLQELLAVGTITEEIEEWANAYTFSRADLIDLYRLVLQREAAGS